MAKDALPSRLITMRAPASASRAGAHCSDFFAVDTPWHHHDLHQLVYAFEDSLEIEGRAGRYRVPSQFAAWIPAGTVHRTRLQKVRSGSVFLAAHMVASEPGAPRVIPVTSLMREMILHAMRWPLSEPLDRVGERYFECFAALAAGWIEQEVKLLLPASDDARIRAAMEHTRASIASVTLHDVCRAVGMSERSLRRKFRAAVGLTWEEYRQRQRLVHALEALERSDASIGAIAAEVGYEDQAAFAKSFRAVMGMAPSVYRRSRR